MLAVVVCWFGDVLSYSSGGGSIWRTLALSVIYREAIFLARCRARWRHVAPPRQENPAVEYAAGPLNQDSPHERGLLWELTSRTLR